VGIRAFRGGDRISFLYFNRAGGLNIEVLPAEWPDPVRSDVFHIRPHAQRVHKLPDRAKYIHIGLVEIAKTYASGPRDMDLRFLDD